MLNTKTHYNNWRKKGEQYSKSNTTEEKEYSKSIEKNEKSASEVLTSDELNTLASKLVKAEILGNKALVEKLKAQLDAAKKAKEHAGPSPKTQRECKEIIVLTESNAKRLKTPSEENLPRTSKKQKLNLQQDYMLRDEKYSINNLVSTFLLLKKRK